jgi:hypothetical protein
MMPNNLFLAMKTVAGHWQHLSRPWLIGGSCGLVLQGVEVSASPRDLDIYIDEEGAAAFHDALVRYATDKPSYSETDKYRSTLSHYVIEGVPVELVAGFEVCVPGAAYRVDISGLMSFFAPEAIVMNTPVRLMPLPHELLFNLLRDRPDRYIAIAETMRPQLVDHLPAICTMVEGNRLDAEWVARMASLLGTDEATIRPVKGGAPCRT